MKIIPVLVFSILALLSCNETSTISHEKDLPTSPSTIFDTVKADTNFITDFEALSTTGGIHAVIEIPAGTVEKYEADKSDGKIKLEYRSDAPRIIDYLPYPSNYGFIPKTLLSKESGGDGDPLDVIVLGPPIERSSLVKCKLIGVLYLLDRGEQDDKLIAVSHNSSLYDISNIRELNDDYPGITDILKIWFANYKGPYITESEGFGDKSEALDILKQAIDDYNDHNE